MDTWCFALPEEFTTAYEEPRVEVTEPEKLDGQGVARKIHYGDGKQPWDDILEAGWGPAFAAANVLKYLRRNKQVEDSRKKATWYWLRLNELARGPQDQVSGIFELRELLHRLTPEELFLLRDEES